MEREHKPEVIATGFHFLEGPRWRNGQLYFSDFYGGEAFALEPSGEVRSLCKLPKWVSGLGFAPNGDLLIVGVVEQKVYRCSGNGRVTEYADLSGIASHHCNDMFVDESGRAYVSHFGYDMPSSGLMADQKSNNRIAPTRIFTVSPDGEVGVAADGLVFPNGMARTPDGKMLIVAETFGARLSAFDITGEGALSNHRIWADFGNRDFAFVPEALTAKVVLPDGITVDSEGAVWAADAGGGGAVRVTADGTITDRITLPGLTAYAVALGGDDMKTLYLCAAPALFTDNPLIEKRSVLFSTRVETAGVPA